MNNTYLGGNEMLEFNKIYNMDCIEGIKLLDDGSVDLIVTSPPYNAKKEYEDELTLEEYRKFASEWVKECIRVLKPNGSFWLNVGYTKLGKNETMPLTYLYYPLINIPLIQEIVWHYEGGMSYKKRFTHRTERWMWFSKNPDKLTFNLDDVRDITLNRTIDKRNHPLGKNPTDYWYFDRVVSGTGKVSEKTAHPCQFPEKMIERIIKACSNESEIILDPFMGSGTTAFVSKKLNRNYIGFELNEEYIEIANKRLENIK